VGRYPAVVAAFLCAALSAQTVEFNRDVRPILSDRCFLCHGPDAAAKNVPRRLDLEADAKADRAGRRAIVESNPAASELIRRINAADATRMPPAYSRLELTPKEKDTLHEWIAQGARWQVHWAFLPPIRPDPPAVRDRAWPRNPIDRFILARVEREGLRPSPEAAPARLLRRAALDLTGIPPAPDEVEAFTNDRAWERAVDRLLASPRYGERMAAIWLDAARYADTNGYQYDGERSMWRWRDWVIEAFNTNMPYDRFAVEQIAGDLLPNATLDQRIATGFNRNHRGNTEDGIIAEEYAVEYVVDRVETTATVFLGLTMGCARCHNHKYDPITQREFYQLFAYFNNVPELGRAMKYGNSPPVIPAPTAEQQEQLAAIGRRIAAAERALDARRAEIDRGVAGAVPPSRWGPSAGLEVQVDEFAGGAPRDLGQVARFEIEDRFTLSAWVRADAAPDGPVMTRMADSPRGKGYGLHFDRGRVHVHLTSAYDSDALRVESEETLAPGRWHHVVATYTGSRMADGVSVFVDGRPLKLRVLQDNLYRPFGNAGRPQRDPFRVGGGWGPDRRFNGKIEDARAYARILTGDEIAAMSAAPGRPAATDRARWHYLESAAPPDLRDAWARLTALRLDRERLERSFPTVMVMAERPQRRDTYVLLRGAYDKPGEKVAPGVPSVLPPLPAGAPPNRLALARWLVDPSNPLTARVAVNRLWQMMFGAGLVKTAEDFGVQGEWPSHPELLDWLATEFVRTGWDIKAMLRLIATSATYRQSSRATPQTIERDPENRLLARGPRFRLAAEMLRDQALAASGLLVEKIGGPSVKPYQPDGLWKEISMQDMEYRRSTGGDLYRRGLYTFWKRTIAPPMMMNFDAANREACVVRPSRSNTPLQALNLMNDVTFVEAARLLGQRAIREGGASRDARLRRAFRLVLAREPSPAELDILGGALAFHIDHFAGRPADAAAYLKHGDSPSDPAIDPRELAAYAAVASLILNLDEAVTRE
jgi:hypothetical protein